MRRLIAHLEHRGSPGQTLCGRAACSVMPCPDCLARWEAMTQVHVQSTRRPDLAFCGATIQGAGILSVRLGELDDDALRSGWRYASSIAYVTAADARQVLQDHRVPLHAPCVLNLGRFLGRLGVVDGLILPSDESSDPTSGRRRAARSARSSPPARVSLASFDTPPVADPVDDEDD